jgi:hypothetical protein
LRGRLDRREGKESEVDVDPEQLKLLECQLQRIANALEAGLAFAVQYLTVDPKLLIDLTQTLKTSSDALKAAEASATSGKEKP